MNRNFARPIYIQGVVATSTHRRKWWERRSPGESAPMSRHELDERFMQLAMESQSAMLKLAMRLWEGDRTAADETVQEGIVAAFRSVRNGQFTDFANFRPWILRIVLNSFYQEIRRNKRFVSMERFTEWSENRTTIQPDPMNGQFAPEIRAAIQSLPKEQRECVLLVDVDELEYSEAAAVLGIPIGTIRSRLARARIKMACYLASVGYGDETNG